MVASCFRRPQLTFLRNRCPPRPSSSACRRRASRAEKPLFLQPKKPWGFILFKRNVDYPESSEKTWSRRFRRAVDREDAPVLIDQEADGCSAGPPHWPKYPPGRAYGRMAANDPLMKRELTRLGARVDRPRPASARDHGGLAFRSECPVPALICHWRPGLWRDAGDGGADGRAAAEADCRRSSAPSSNIFPAWACRGRQPFLLPVVDAGPRVPDETDFLPFPASGGHAPRAMTAHVVYFCVKCPPPAGRLPGQSFADYPGRDRLRRACDERRPVDEGAVRQLWRRTAASLWAGCDVVLTATAIWWIKEGHRRPPRRAQGPCEATRRSGIAADRASAGAVRSWWKAAHRLDAALAALLKRRHHGVKPTP